MICRLNPFYAMLRNKVCKKNHLKTETPIFEPNENNYRDKK